jgi:DNA polymerase III subunit epsilon
MLRTILGEDITRWVLGWRCPPGPLKDYYRTDTATIDTPYNQVEMLAIDIETTGLDPLADEIVSVGFVPVIRGRIRLEDAQYHLVRPERAVSESSAKVHGLLDDALQQAAPLADIMPHVLAAMTGRIGIAHHAAVETGFLSQACRQLWGYGLEAPFLDTLAMEHRLMSRHNQGIADGALKLAACRARYNLPRLKVHDALSDALGCAELFLAQAAHSSGRKPAAIRDLMT